jgi:hypothetical protein
MDVWKWSWLAWTELRAHAKTTQGFASPEMETGNRAVDGPMRACTEARSVCVLMVPRL